MEIGNRVLVSYNGEFSNSIQTGNWCSWEMLCQISRGHVPFGLHIVTVWLNGLAIAMGECMWQGTGHSHAMSVSMLATSSLTGPLLISLGLLIGF